MESVDQNDSNRGDHCVAITDVRPLYSAATIRLLPFEAVLPSTI